ncbi:hypothetical protein JTE90_023830 [Oedothorax gibbosus]|uniref:Uncharacterized protein n=1 Tax=Oedothorax gibbosus TaxID=931172 RepID=A0AAV6VHL7_9ARAC|nr:hypothetical protein JTE90_023830 [Oedothorax gibbosus]
MPIFPAHHTGYSRTQRQRQLLALALGGAVGIITSICTPVETVNADYKETAQNKRTNHRNVLNGHMH